MFATIALAGAGRSCGTVVGRADLRLLFRIARALRFLTFGFIAYIVAMSAAHAACTGASSTLGGSSISFTSIGQTVSICVTRSNGGFTLRRG
jgi:hypothetical protein